jgi:hypothetical protein
MQYNYVQHESPLKCQRKNVNKRPSRKHGLNLHQTTGTYFLQLQLCELQQTVFERYARQETQQILTDEL